MFGSLVYYRQIDAGQSWDELHHQAICKLIHIDEQPIPNHGFIYLADF